MGPECVNYFDFRIIAGTGCIDLRQQQTKRSVILTQMKRSHLRTLKAELLFNGYYIFNNEKSIF